MAKHKAFQLAHFKALDEEQGIFEAIVAVFNNVDRYGERIMPGAFKNSLAAWEAKGRPIPVIFSHQWENLDAHIGELLEAKEVERGLYVKGQLEMDEPFARRVWKKMSKGTIAEFSFAYDVISGAEAKEDGEYVYELRELDLLEVGPCLVGVNPETELLGVKGLRAALEGEGREKVLQELHDMLVSLGAKCGGEDHDTPDTGPLGEGDGEGGGQGEGGDAKPKGSSSSTLAARVALELIESGIEESA